MPPPSARGDGSELAAGFEPAPDPDAGGPSRGATGKAVRGVLGLTLGLCVAAGVCYGLGVHPRDAVRQMVGVSPWIVVGCVAAGFGVFAFQSLRWHSVMHPLLGIPYAQAYRAQVVGFMFNAILPARGGDLLRVQYLGRATGKSRATILGTEIVDRWLDWWGWIPAFLVFCAVSTPPAWLYKALAIFVSVLLVWAGVIIWLTRNNYQPRRDSRWANIYSALCKGLHVFQSRRIWLIAVLLAPLPWIWESIVLTQAAKAFGIELDFLMAFSVMIGFNLAMVVPSPGAIGSIEAGGTAALTFFGVDQSKALAFMFVYHLSQLLPGIAAGAAILVWEKQFLFDRRPLAKVPIPLDQTEDATLPQGSAQG